MNKFGFKLFEITEMWWNFVIMVRLEKVSFEQQNKLVHEQIHFMNMVWSQIKREISNVHYVYDHQISMMTIR